MRFPVRHILRRHQNFRHRQSAKPQARASPAAASQTSPRPTAPPEIERASATAPGIQHTTFLVVGLAAFQFFPLRLTSKCGAHPRPDHLDGAHTMRNRHDRVAIHALRLWAQARHSRSTARVESTRTPSRSKRMAEQEKIGISNYLNTEVASPKQQCPRECEPRSQVAPPTRRLAGGRPERVERKPLRPVYASSRDSQLTNSCS